MASKKRPTKPAIAEDTKVGNAPSVRLFTEWTPSRIRAAERLAENGDLTQAVMIVEWLLTDDAIVASLEPRVNALLGLEPTFDQGTGKRAKRALKALEVEEDWWEAYPESELKQLVRWDILLGGSLARQNWIERNDHGGRVLPMISFWHPQTLRWHWQERRLSVRNARSEELTVVPGDGEWILHTSNGLERFWSHGLWRSLSRWVLFKQLAMGDWSRHSEKGSLLVATAPEGATAKQRRELAEDLQASGSDTVVALAAGFDLKLVEVSANTQVIYNAQVKAADDAIRIRIRGGNLTSKVDEGGSRAAAETQAKGGDGANLKADANALSTTLHTQSLGWWAEFNFGDKRLAPWPAWPVEPEEDKAQKATMVKTLGEGLTVWDKLGFDVDPKAVTEEFGLAFFTGRSRPREPDPVPGAQPGQEGDGKAKPGKPPAKPKAQLKGPASGSVEGQTYVDDLSDDASGKAARAFKRTFLARLSEVVASSSDYEELRRNIKAAWGDSEPPERVREILQKAMVLADLAGQASALQDAT
jgi:phage gp29-like protein